MRVLHVVPTYLPATRYGGPIVSVHGLARAQAELGADVSVLTTSVDGSIDSDVAHEQAVLLDGVKVHYFRSPFLRRIYFSWRMYLWLKKNIHRFDVLHLHSVFLYPMTMAARLAKAASVPYVIAPRGMLVPELFAQRSSWIKKLWIACFDRRTLQDAHAFHATSALEIDDAKRLGVPVQNPLVMFNGVVPPTDPCAERPHAPPYVLYLGRLSEKKRIDWLIRGLAQTHGLDLVIAGGDERGTRATLMALCQQLKLEQRVQFLDEIDAQQKWQWLQHAQALALVSINENFGNAVAESLMVERPVIVSSGVGLAKDVQQYGLGWVIEDQPSLNEAMRACAQAPVGRSAHALTYANDHLGWPAIAQKCIALYRDICAQAVASAPRDTGK